MTPQEAIEMAANTLQMTCSQSYNKEGGQHCAWCEAAAIHRKLAPFVRAAITWCSIIDADPPDALASKPE